ncbi:pollen receptor-like kinase 3 [Panicum miliaceum]|uniref:Pollen receptor-like kinase 3 n=1 Tax=Panicum miliaceum TaxID=4540 RepID=A0A3L6S0N5_PANMI|nr:pollen receptor-like kinase 3 [Panicum miliaceum]
MAPSPHCLLFLVAATIAAAAAALPAAVAAENDMPVADALVKLKKSFTNSSSLSSWLITDKDGDKHPCAPGSHEWHGVVCSGGKVLGLRLNDLELGGTIDVDALASFPRLRSVSFAGNNFSGPLPAFHQLKALKSMYLSNNQFSGPLPEGFFANLSHLKKLWLDGNQLNGSIPASVAQATSLLELHLDRNDFTGELPPAPPPALKSFNVSENDLEGVVPEPFRRFDASMFAGNEYLCFVPTNVKSCKREQAVAADSSHRRVVMVLATLLVVAVAVVVMCACSSQPSSRDMEGLEEKPPAYMVKQASTQQPQKRSTSWLGRRAGSSLGFGHRRTASAAKVDDLSSRSAGDLVMVNSSKGSFGLADLMKAAAEVIGSGGLGSAYKAVMANGVAVVVKRSRDMNRATKDAFQAEMKRLGVVRHANLLPPLAYHYRSDEKLLVYEYIPKGSLLYVLHGDRGMDYAALDWPMRLKVAAGVARGMACLHTELAAHEVPHGNLKSANVLLAPDFEPLLVGFGYSGFINHMQSPHSVFARRAPECVAGHPYLQNAKGGTDLVMWATSAMADGFESDLFDPAIMAAWKFALLDMKRLMKVAVDCVEADPEKRPDMKEVAARVEEVVATALATVRESGSEDAASRSSHATYVREGSIQRMTSVGERSSRRGSSDYAYGIS